jgi:hypothetical protein
VSFSFGSLQFHDFKGGSNLDNRWLTFPDPVKLMVNPFTHLQKMVQ